MAYAPVIPELWRWRQENCDEFKVSLGYVERPVSQKEETKTKNTHNSKTTPGQSNMELSLTSLKL
jgi:hypothetical protein